MCWTQQLFEMNEKYCLLNQQIDALLQSQLDLN